MSTSHEQATSSGRSDSQAGDDGDMEIREDLYEEAFSRMKKAAGVSDVDEVVRRFETQEETTNHLLELQVTIFLVFVMPPDFEQNAYKYKLSDCHIISRE